MTASPTDDLASAERRIQELTRELSRAKAILAGTFDANTLVPSPGGYDRYAISLSITDVHIGSLLSDG